MMVIFKSPFFFIYVILGDECDAAAAKMEVMCPRGLPFLLVKILKFHEKLKKRVSLLS